MTAPILREEAYLLSTEIEDTKKGRVYLRVEKEYQYNNVWAARNTYEKFFSERRYEYKEPNYCDRWINMIGDETCMIVKMVYVFLFTSLQEAKKKEKEFKEEREILSNQYRWEGDIKGSVIDLPGTLAPSWEIEKEDEANSGRKKCELLREIRVKIAKANNIDYEPAVCTHKGTCLGTCPVCDNEVRYLDEKIKEKEMRGEKIDLAGIAKEDIKSANVELTLDEDIIEFDAPVADGGFDVFDFIDENLPFD